MALRMQILLQCKEWEKSHPGKALPVAGSGEWQAEIVQKKMTPEQLAKQHEIRRIHEVIVSGA